APASGALADHGAVLVRFGVRDRPGTVAAQLRLDDALTAADGAVRDAEGRALVLFGPGWKWDAQKKELRAALAPDRPAVLAVLTKALTPLPPALTAERYDQERKACADAWKALLARGMRLEVPEAVVQNAWRSLVVGNFLLAVGDRMHYSAGNAY